MHLVFSEIFDSHLDILAEKFGQGSIGIASGHAVNLVLTLVLQLIELACGDGASIVTNISVDGTLTNTVGYAAAASFVVGLAISSGIGLDGEGAVVEGNHLCCRLAQVIAFIRTILEALLLIFGNHLIYGWSLC